MSAQNKAIDWSRWQGVRGHFTYWKGWIAWQIYMPLPVGILPYWTFSWLLPSVGDYCYWDDAIAAMNAPSAGVTAPPAHPTTDKGGV